jgi:aryl-alcohol dehydrogenase-like predicted oxidoreductase
VGASTGRSQAESVAIVRRALDLGVNFIDTSEAYGTEEIVGRAIRGVDRSSVVLSTKIRPTDSLTPRDVQRSLEGSLSRLGTDYVDVYHLHGVALEAYDHLLAEIVPTLQKLRQQGKIGFIGITERFTPDPQHRMLQRALQDDVWDVMMVGFNMLNQSARDLVFPATMKKDIGVLVMFAVRLALSRPERLAAVIQQLIASGQVDADDIDERDPLAFLVDGEGARSLIEAAYRFCRDEPGTDVILSGTGNVDHLEANVDAFSRPPLLPEDLARLRRVFRRSDSVSG